MVNKRKNGGAGGGGKKKRSKKYYTDFGKKGSKKNALCVGDKGFLITCNGDDRGAVIEGYRILNQFADIRYGPEKITSQEKEAEENAEDDIEAELKKELTDIKSASSGQVERRFQSVQTKASSVVFIKTNIDDPYLLINDIFTGFESGESGNVRHCLKFVPVMETCHSSNDDIIKKCTNTLIPKFFHAENQQPKKFCLTWKVRCNSTVNREAVFIKLVDEIEKTGVGHVTDYVDPDIALFFEVIGNVCAMGILQHFKRFRKYNLQIVSEASRSQNGTSEKSSNVEKVESNSSVDKVESKDINNTSHSSETATDQQESGSEVTKNEADHVKQTIISDSKDKTDHLEGDSEQIIGSKTADSELNSGNLLNAET